MQSIWDEFFSIIHYVEGGFGISLNILFIYFTIFVHSSVIREYRVLLGNTGIIDLIGSITIMLVQPRVICVGWTYAYVALGPSKYLGAGVSFALLGLTYNMIFYSFLAFPVSFGFRYYILVRPMPKIRTLVLLCCGLYSISLLQFVAFLMSQTPTAAVRNELQQQIPTYDLTNETIFGSLIQLNWLAVINQLVIFAPIFPIYGLVFYVRHKVHEFIDDDTKHNFSDVVKQGHKKLMLALMVLATAPAIFVFLPFSLLLCYHIGILRFEVIEYMVFTMLAMMPIARPIANLIFVRPYNKAFRHMLSGNLCFHRIKIQDMSHYTATQAK